MSLQKTYKWCFVPKCKSTTIATPNKLFFFVPENQITRKKWFEIARRPDEPIKSRYYCCQDHFDIKVDMDNYVRYCLMGAPIKLKKGVVPHVFECQPDRIEINILSQSTVQTSNRKRKIVEILSDTENQENICPGTTETLQQCHKIRKTTNWQNINIIATSLIESVTTPNKTAPSTSQPLFAEDSEIVCDGQTFVKNSQIKSGPRILSLNKESQSSINEDHCPKDMTKRSYGVQVCQKLIKPHIRSKSIMCKPCTVDACCQSETEVIDRMSSPIRLRKKKATPANSNTSSSVVVSSSTNVSSGHQLISGSEYNLSSYSEEKREQQKKFKETALNVTRYFISIDPRKYIGLDDKWSWIIHLLHSSTQCSIDDIKLTLMKIRTDDTFSRLGDQFGLSTSQASRIFNKTVEPLVHYLKTLVYCPDQSSIKKNLPIAFRANYSKVCAIIDAFEIEIEKPSNPLQQALTWSEYKKCNTLKYLIACTPDGFIICISSGYGGRISDNVLFEESKLMDILPQNCVIMADRGFKQIQTILNQKGCELLRPPSVSSNSKSTKEEVLKTKSIASLRIHVERVIRRIREYKILEPHSCLDLNIMSYIDNVLNIVTSLINLQMPIIKK